MSASDPQLRPIDSLAEAFSLPDDIPSRYSVLHTEIVNRMRNEARTVSMGTVQTLILARVAYYFVVMKHLEDNDQLNTTAHKFMLDSWLRASVEFNKMVQASESKSRTTMLVEVQNVLRNSVKKIAAKDPVLAREITMEWNEEFARIDA